MSSRYFEVRNHTLPDITGKLPKTTFEQDYDEAQMTMLCPYGFLFPYGGCSGKPVIYFHHTNIDKIRFNGFTEPGDRFDLPQHHGKHHQSVAQPEFATFTKKYESV